MRTACTFAGHRPRKLPWGDNETRADFIKMKDMLLASVLLKAEEGCDTFYSGLAHGTEIAFAGLALKAREMHKGLRLIAVVQNGGRMDFASEEERRRYDEIMRLADGIATVGGSSPMRRARWMAGNSTHLIAVYTGEEGVTRDTIAYADKLGLNTLIISPVTFDYESRRRYRALDMLK